MFDLKKVTTEKLCYGTLSYNKRMMSNICNTHYEYKPTGEH